MKLKDKSKEELEVLSYTDLTELILKENKKSMSTKDIFMTICELLELSDEEFTNKIGDFYTSLTTDKRFILLNNAMWDLKDKHKVEIVLDDDDEEDEEYTDESEEEDIEDEEDTDESVEITDDEVDLDDDDDMDDLTIIDGDEEEDI